MKPKIEETGTTAEPSKSVTPFFFHEAESNFSSLKQNTERFLRAVVRYKHWILLSGLGAVLITLIYCKLQTPVYTATAKILIEPPARAEAGDMVGLYGVGGYGAPEDNELQTQKDVFQSRVVAERVVERLELKKTSPFDTSKDPAALLMVMTNAEVSLKSRTMLISAKTTDPQLAAKIANGLVDAYIDISDEKERTWIGRTVDQMRKEASGLQNELWEQQRKLKAYEKEHPGVASKATLENQLNSLNSELVTTSAEKLKLRTELSELASFQKQGASLGEHPRIAKDPYIEQVTNLLQQKQVELAQLLNVYKEKFPLVLEKKAEIGELENILAEREGKIVGDLKSRYLLLSSREHELKAAIESKNEELNNLLEEFGGYQGLAGQYELSKSLYAMIVDRMDRAAIIGRVRQVRVKVLSPAIVPGRPSFPRTGRAALTNFICAAALSSYLLFLFTMILKPIDSEEEIVETVKIPALTHISELVQGKGGDGSRLILDNADSSAKDALHVLQTALSAGGGRRILFTSTSPSEGKTFLVYNLGTFLAREGKRVLLVGSDFRNPSLTKLVRTGRAAGSIEDYIGGKCSEKETIRSTEESGLFFLGSERPLASALAVITSPRFQELLDNLTKQFDYVFLDSPPVQLFPDSEMLAEKSDQVIFVVRSGKTSVWELLKAVGKVQKGGARVAGAVLNFKSLRWSNYYYYNHYYGNGRQRRWNGMFQGVSEYASRVWDFLEKRLHLRYKAAFPLECTALMPKGERVSFPAVTTELSEGGLRAEYQEDENTARIDLAGLKILDIKIKLPEEEALPLKGAVVWKERVGGVVHLGLAFCGLTLRDAGFIKDLLERSGTSSKEIPEGAARP